MISSFQPSRLPTRRSFVEELLTAPSRRSPQSDGLLPQYLAHAQRLLTFDSTLDLQSLLTKIFSAALKDKDKNLPRVIFEAATGLQDLRLNRLRNVIVRAPEFAGLLTFLEEALPDLEREWADADRSKRARDFLESLKTREPEVATYSKLQALYNDFSANSASRLTPAGHWIPNYQRPPAEIPDMDRKHVLATAAGIVLFAATFFLFSSDLRGISGFSVLLKSRLLILSIPAIILLPIIWWLASVVKSAHRDSVVRRGSGTSSTGDESLQQIVQQFTVLAVMAGITYLTGKIWDAHQSLTVLPKAYGAILTGLDFAALVLEVYGLSLVDRLNRHWE
jgi:hypothetical protein